MIIYGIYNTERMPQYKTEGSAGGDLSSAMDVIISPHTTVKVSTGLKLVIPEGHVMIIKPRSSLAVKKNLLVIDGTIDSDYRGEISVVVHNLSDKSVTISQGERIAQGIILKYERPTEMIDLDYENFADKYPTERGEGGFGSTGA